MAFMYDAVSILLVLIHLYWSCYGFFQQKGWTLELVNKILVALTERQVCFQMPYIPKYLPWFY